MTPSPPQRRGNPMSHDEFDEKVAEKVAKELEGLSRRDTKRIHILSKAILDYVERAGGTATSTTKISELVPRSAIMQMMLRHQLFS
jgi:hypothetical protein